jgi:thymidylate synthase ThyX
LKYLRNTTKDINKLTAKYDKSTKGNSNSYVKLLEYSSNGDKEAAANIIYTNTHLPYEEILNNIKNEDIEKVINTYVKHRQGRWHKVGKAFETTYYTFEIMADFGAYKDLQRHRMLTQERQLFTTQHGYEIPKDIIEAKQDRLYKRAMDLTQTLYEKLEKDFPEEAQYVVTHGHLIRWKMKMNLREAFHLCELRSSPQGHPSYRKIAQEIYRLIKSVNPIVGNSMKFVNMQDPGLERLSAEVRREEKLNAVKNKTPRT